MTITHKIKMDLTRPGITPRIPAVQGDAYARSVSIALFADRKPWRIPTGATGLVSYCRPNRSCGAYDTLPDGTSAVRFSGNTADILIAPEALSMAGTVSLMVTMLLGQRRLSTFSVEMEVSPDCVSGWTAEDGTARVTAFLPAPVYAQPGQIFAADAVDETGHVLSVKTADPAQWLEAYFSENGIAQPSKALYVTVAEQDGLLSADKTHSELYEAYQNGHSIFCCLSSGEVLPLAAVSPAVVLFQGEIDREYQQVQFRSDGSVHYFSGSYSTLEKLPNALTINGAAYDGSAPVTLDTREFLVTATGTPDAGYTADKPYEEVLAAYEGGRTVICVLNGGMAANFRLPLIMASDGVLAFALSPIPGTIFMVSLTPSGCMVSESISTMTIGDQEWDFDGPVDFTDTINGMINAKVGELENGKSAYEIAVDHGFEGSEEEWLASLKGSVSDGDTLLGQTPLTMTEDASVKLVGSGTHSYTVKGKTVADLSTMTVTSTNATLTEHEDHIEIVAGEAANWYGAYVTLTVKGLTVGKTYVCVIDQLGLDTANLINNGYYMVKNSSGTELARMGNDTTGLNSVEFTPDTSGITITCYPCNNYYWGQNYRTAHIGDLYINEAADGTQRSAIINKSGSFTGSFALGQVSAGVTITADPACEVFRVSSDNEPVLPLAGKTVVCFGDSLFGMYRGDTSAPAYIAQKTGATVYNVGFGGCRMSAHPTSGYAAFSMWALAKAVAQNSWTDQDEQAVRGSSYFTEQLALLKSIDFSQVDAIVIHYGTNDFTAGSTGVAIDNAEKPQDVNTLCGAMRYSITALLTAYPHLRIFVSVPAFRYWTAEDGTITYSDTYTNGNGNKLTDFVDAIANTAKEYNLPVIDSYYSLGINKINAATFLGDGVHHNETGRKRFGEYIGSCILAGY